MPFDLETTFGLADPSEWSRTRALPHIVVHPKPSPLSDGIDDWLVPPAPAVPNMGSAPGLQPGFVNAGFFSAPVAPVANPPMAPRNPIPDYWSLIPASRVGAMAWDPPKLPLFSSSSNRPPTLPPTPPPIPLGSPPTLSGASAEVTPASYQAGMRTWEYPVGPPDIFGPWREQAINGLLGLYNYLRSGGGFGSSGNRGSEDKCDELYEEDSNICRAERSSTCWAQAAERHGNCLAGRPIPPLGFGGR
jgi:hypothetical protein